MEYLLIVDGSSLLSTQYYGNMPATLKFESDEEKRKLMYDKLLHTSDGRYTNGILGFFRTLFSILRESKPTHLAIAWDVGRDTFRRDISSDYKGNRKDTPEPLKQQFKSCQELCERMGIVCLKDKDFEADDFCGTLAKNMEKVMPVRILTKDRDYFQLITGKTQIWFIMSSKDKAEALYDKYHMDRSKYRFPDKTFKFDSNILKNEYGYAPEQAIMVKALMGDASDNIKGVPGVGEAVAIKLANHYGNLESLYAAIKDKSPEELEEVKKEWKALGINRPPIKALLKEDPEELVGEDAAITSALLGTIRTDLNLDDYFLMGFSPDELKIAIDPNEAKEALAEYEIKTINTNY